MKGGQAYAPPTDEDKFYALWIAINGPQMRRQVPVSELIPGYENKHSVDFFDPLNNVAIDINGGTFARGSMGHCSGTGIDRDYKKAVVFASQGIPLFYLSTPQSQRKDYLELLLALVMGIGHPSKNFWKQYWKA